MYNKPMNNENENEYIATDIYDRIDATNRGESGSVYSDLQEVLETGNFAEFEDYFGDLDPFEFLWCLIM